MSEFPNVQVGQVWADNDKRMKGRMIKILQIDPENIHGERKALIEVVTDAEPVVVSQVGKTRRILLRRLRPTSTGYRLVKDV